ncbi:phosphotransferase family protein [soil metagenome]
MKPALSKAAVVALIGEAMGNPPNALEPLAEGMESQAFRFELDGAWFVLRLNPALRGFEKDARASSALGGRVPVPRVLRIGEADNGVAYCISEWLPGTTLEDLSVSDAASMVEQVDRVRRLIAESDVSAIEGFGDFDPEGSGPARRWRDVLQRTLEDAGRDLSGAITDRSPDVTALLSAYERLIDCCPEDRGLIHGDFGSNNVLAQEGRITGVLDWDLAMVGDPLYDVANVYFWATHLHCMEVQADYFTRTLSDLPNYSERVACYALRIGLEEARENVSKGDMKMAAWALRRSFDFVGTRLRR